jgi:hypothetical protein
VVLRDPNGGASSASLHPFIAELCPPLTERRTEMFLMAIFLWRRPCRLRLLGIAGDTPAATVRLDRVKAESVRGVRDNGKMEIRGGIQKTSKSALDVSQKRARVSPFQQFTFSSIIQTFLKIK